MNSKNSSLIDLALLSLRLMAGFVFFFHGGQKLFGLFGGYGIEGTAGWMESIGIPFPLVSTVLAGSAEFLGGIALISGLGVRIAAPILVVTMFVASTKGHTGFDIQKGGMEHALTMGVIALALGLSGAGRYTLTSLFARATAPSTRLASH